MIGPKVDWENAITGCGLVENYQWDRTCGAKSFIHALVWVEDEDDGYAFINACREHVDGVHELDNFVQSHLIGQFCGKQDALWDRMLNKCVVNEEVSNGREKPTG